MIESLLLSILGTVCAIVIGWWAVEILRNAMPESLPRITAIALVTPASSGASARQPSPASESEGL